MNLPARPILLIALSALVIASCSTSTRVVAPEPPLLAPTTPQSAVKLFEWAVVNRRIDALEELFTADFAFLSAGLDSAGNPSREVVGDRDSMLARFRCMFSDSGAASLRLSFDQNLIPMSDPRPGHVDSLFKTVRTSLDFAVETGDGTTLEVTGYALFFLARGDTAAIPQDLIHRGFKKDKNRWWISRWEDETIAPAGAGRHATTPVKSWTLGRLLELACRP